MTDPTTPLTRLSPLLPLLARFLFVAILLPYYWHSGMTKLGDGVFGVLSPSAGAYAQIFPKAYEAVGYDASRLGLLHWAVTVAGMWAEFLLPLMLLLGLLTRLSAVGMIGFVVVQSLTDLYGHGGIAYTETVGRWFDGTTDGVILDQRAFWVFLLLVLVVQGGGLISLDRAIFRNAAWPRPGARQPGPVRPQPR